MIVPSTAIVSDLRKLATGTALAFGGIFLGNVLIYLYGLLIAWFLGATSVGLYFLAMVVMQVISAVCRLGLPEGLLRFVSIHSGQEDVSRVKGTIFSALALAAPTTILVGALLFLLAEPFSVYLLRTPDVVSYIRWFAVTLPFFTLFVLMIQATQALKRMDLVVFSRDFLQPVIMLLLSLLFLYFSKTAGSFLAAYLLSFILSLGVSLYLLGRICPLFGTTTAALFEWKTLLAFSLPITASDLAHYLFRWSDTFLLSFFRASSEVGIYNAALRTTLLLNLLAVSVNALYAPIIADHHHQERYPEIQLILRTIVRWCLTLALPLVFAMCVLAGDILTLWGPEFVAGSTALIVLAVSQLLFVPSNLVAFTFLMCGKQYLEVGNTIVVTILNIAMNLILIPRYGILGAALSMLASQCIAFVARWLELRYVLGVHLYTATYVKPFIALTPLVVLVVMFRDVMMDVASSACLGSQLGAMALIATVIAIGYVAILYVLGFEEEDRLLWRQLPIGKKLSLSGH